MADARRRDSVARPAPIQMDVLRVDIRFLEIPPGAWGQDQAPPEQRPCGHRSRSWVGVAGSGD
jgi:hypothetical protein